MTKQNINIIGHQVLYDILDELRSYLSFEILNFKNEDDYINNSITNLEYRKNSTYIFKELNTKFLHKIQIDNNQIFTTPDKPIEIFKLIENINIHLIRQKYLTQSNISFKKYLLNINTREISKDDKRLKLTEKEIDTIIFLVSKKTPQSSKDLLIEVWGYIADIETHTVETHIYRLRKKILDKFDDKSFIINHVDGYQIL